MIPVLCTQVHCLTGGQILLMRRNKQPNLGLWVAPGGKIEIHESPYECAVRELYEETGLSVCEMSLRGMVTLVIPTIKQPILHFLYLVTSFTGEIKGEEREGTLQWWPVGEIEQIEMPPANRKFLPEILNGSQTFYQAKYVYNDEERLIEVIEYQEPESKGEEAA